MHNDDNVDLLLEWESETDRWRRRASFLFVLVLQGIFLLLLAFEPQLFTSAARLVGIRPRPKRKMQTTFLTFPTQLLNQHVNPPKTNNLSDKNRLAQGPAPKIDKNGLTMPYLHGNTPLPKLAGGKKQPSPPPPPPKPAPKAQAKTTPPKPKPQLEAQLRLQNVTPPHSQRRIHIPDETPGEAIQQSLRAAAAGQAQGEVVGPGSNADQLQNLHPNFSTSGPIILSNTRGVNFGPYLARVVYVVRRNWYSMIPESAQLGERGRVALVFEIVKNGSVNQIKLLSTSGSQALDLAALGSIKASNPFPPLPSEFTGNHLILEFVYFYNERPGN